MSSSVNDTEKSASVQGVHWNEEDWQGLLKRLPCEWEEQVIKLKAWQRTRKLACIAICCEPFRCMRPVDIPIGSWACGRQ